MPAPTQAEIDHGVPMFLDQLVCELRFGTSAPDIAETAIHHGRDSLREGFTIAQLVHDYGDVCQSVTEMAIERDARITADDFRALNRCLDDAIAGSVTEYARQQQDAIALGIARENEQLAVLASEARICLEAVRLAFDTILSGSVGVTGGTAKLLDNNLSRAQGLTNRMLAEIEAVDEPINRSR